jgi:hypothetical protein
MILTTWTGDFTGDLSIGSSVNMYYASVEGEFPMNVTESVDYTGTFGKIFASSDKFKTLFDSSMPGTFKARINGNIYEIGGNMQSFSIIGGPETGYLTVDYVPTSSLYRLAWASLTQENLAQGVVIRPTPYKPEHINSLIRATQNIQRHTDIPPTRFNISDNELSGLTYILSPASRIIRILFEDLESALLMISAKYSLQEHDIMVKYTTLSADMIQEFRQWINELEGGL